MPKTLSSQSVKRYIVHAVFIIGVLFFLGAGCGEVVSELPPKPVSPRSVESVNPANGMFHARETILKELRAQSEIKRFANTKELRAFLEERVEERGYGYRQMMTGDISVMKSDFLEKAPSATPSPRRWQAGCCAVIWQQ